MANYYYRRTPVNSGTLSNAPSDFVAEQLARTLDPSGRAGFTRDFVKRHLSDLFNLISLGHSADDLRQLYRTAEIASLYGMPPHEVDQCVIALGELAALGVPLDEMHEHLRTLAEANEYGVMFLEIADFKQNVMAKRLMRKHLGQMKVFLGCSARTRPGDPEHEQASHSGEVIAKADGVVVVGSPVAGSMGAAFDAAGEDHAVAIQIRLQHEDPIEHDQAVTVDRFRRRQAALLDDVFAYWFVKGGWGTFSELLDTLLRPQTGEGSPKPIIVVAPGSRKDFWDICIRRPSEVMNEEQMIDAEDMNFIRFVDSPEEALAMTFEYYRNYDGFKRLRGDDWKAIRRDESQSGFRIRLRARITPEEFEELRAQHPAVLESAYVVDEVASENWDYPNGPVCAIEGTWNDVRLANVRALVDDLNNLESAKSLDIAPDELYLFTERERESFGAAPIVMRLDLMERFARLDVADVTDAPELADFTQLGLTQQQPFSN